MISYTRNFEDVMIGRALKAIEHGFYVDVGASHPVADSNTFALYERGWRGLAIEPQTVFNALWQQHRPFDKLLNVAVSNASGEMTLYKPSDYGQMATLSVGLAQDYAQRGMTLSESTVSVETLSHLLQQARGVGDIHLMSIDVEGAEREALLGLDFQRFRPWLMMLESVLPGVPKTNYEHWEHLLLDAGYEFVYFDAVNRFYVAKEHEDLKAHFQRPPCVWDNFVSAELVHEKKQTELLQQQLQSLQQQSHYVLEHLNGAAELLLSIANQYEAKEDWQACEALLWRIYEKLPTFEALHWKIGGLLVGQDRRAEALTFYQKTAELFPNNRYAHHNVGMLLRWEKRWEESEAAFRRSLAIDPNFSECRMNFGALLLALGRYTEGWTLFEARYLVQPHETPRMSHNIAYPRWTGESLEGKSILVLREQGYGDEIMFVRFAQTLKTRGAVHVTVLCQQAIRSLLATAPGVDAVVCVEELSEWPVHDYWCYQQSLPLGLGITLEDLPAPVPYLTAPSFERQKWRARIEQSLPAQTLKVGINWRGSPEHGNDKHRSLPSVQALQALWAVKGVSFISVQTGEAAARIAEVLVDQPMLALGAELADFADGAALVSELDLVISVDTAMAHLAGALGVPCWVMIPVVETDWRWLTDRSDSPWYPQYMRIYRQTTDYVWDDVVMQIEQSLRQWVAARQS